MTAAAPAPVPALLVVGSRARDGAGGGQNGWRVLVLARGEQGALVQCALTPDEARRAARELEQMAALCDAPGAVR